MSSTSALPSWDTTPEFSGPAMIKLKEAAYVENPHMDVPADNPSKRGPVSTTRHVSEEASR